MSERDWKPPVNGLQELAELEKKRGEERGRSGHWLVLAGLVAGTLLSAYAVGSMTGGARAVARTDAPAIAALQTPSPARIEACNLYAARMATAFPAGGAAAPSPGEEGELAGLSAANRRSALARSAYRDCMLGLRRTS